MLGGGLELLKFEGIRFGGLGFGVEELNVWRLRFEGLRSEGEYRRDPTPLAHLDPLHFTTPTL